MPIIEPKLLKGFRDFLPEAEITKKNLEEKIEAVFRSMGFVPIDTPALEYAEVLFGKGAGRPTNRGIVSRIPGAAPLRSASISRCRLRVSLPCICLNCPCRLSVTISQKCGAGKTPSGAVTASLPSATLTSSARRARHRTLRFCSRCTRRFPRLPGAA